MTADWELYVEENALIADFPAGMPTDEEVYAEVNEQFEQLASQSDVDTHISVLGMDSPLNSDVFEKAQEAADIGTEFGITHWIIVSEGIKNMALNSQIDEISGVESETAETVEEALELATA